jgi:hypothetical protein
MAQKDNCYNIERRFVLYFMMKPVSMASEAQMEWTIFISQNLNWIPQYREEHTCFLESRLNLRSLIMIEVFMGSLCTYTNLLQQYPQIECYHFLSYLFKFNFLSHTTIWRNTVYAIQKESLNKRTEVQQLSLFCIVQLPTLLSTI